MFTLRCTEKLLNRFGLMRPDPAAAIMASPDTALGDWYANPLNIGPRRLILCTSSTSLLSIVTVAGDLGNLHPRLVAELGRLLNDMSIPPAAIERELDAMSEMHYGRTASRSVLGSMNEFAASARYWFDAADEQADLHELNLYLSQFVSLKLERTHPRDEARTLLARSALSVG